MTDYSHITLSADERAKLIDELSAYAETDLLCYFAHEPALYEAQRAAWEPILQPLEAALSLRIARTQGIMPVAQPPQLRARCEEWLLRYDDSALVAAAQLITQLGSVLLAAALMQGMLSLDAALHAASLDEDFQQQHWGDDEAIAERLQQREDKVRAAHSYLLALGEASQGC